MAPGERSAELRAGMGYDSACSPNRPVHTDREHEAAGLPGSGDFAEDIGNPGGSAGEVVQQGRPIHRGQVAIVLRPAAFSLASGREG